MLELDFVFTNFEIAILSALTSQIFIGFSCNIKLFFCYFCLSKPEHYYTMKKKLDGMNIIIQLKVQNHQNTCEATSTTILHGLSFQMLQKMLRPGRTQKHHILLSGNLILTNKRTLKDQFYLEMVSHRVINDILQTPKKEVHFFFFSVCCIVFIEIILGELFLEKKPLNLGSELK